jgi:hypothetical protein
LDRCGLSRDSEYVQRDVAPSSVAGRAGASGNNSDADLMGPQEAADLYVALNGFSEAVPPADRAA